MKTKEETRMLVKAYHDIVVTQTHAAENPDNYDLELVLLALCNTEDKLIAALTAPSETIEACVNDLADVLEEKTILPRTKWIIDHILRPTIAKHFGAKEEK